jgi:hypothetical protein
MYCAASSFSVANCDPTTPASASRMTGRFRRQLPFVCAANYMSPRPPVSIVSRIKRLRNRLNFRRLYGVFASAARSRERSPPSRAGGCRACGIAPAAPRSHRRIQRPIRLRPWRVRQTPWPRPSRGSSVCIYDPSRNGRGRCVRAVSSWGPPSMNRPEVYRT